MSFDEHVGRIRKRVKWEKPKWGVLAAAVIVFALPVFTAAAVLLGCGTVNAAWDGYVEPVNENGGKVSLVDFNNSAAIFKSGAIPMAQNTRDGNMNSAFWGTQATRDIYFRDVPKDWSGYDKLEMWIYSEAATGTEFMVIADVEYGADGLYNYFQTKFRFDWTGWKKFSISLQKMSPNRSADWSKITDLRLTVNGWSMVISDARVYIATLDLIGGDGSSLSANYSEEVIQSAKATMENAVAIYADRSTALKADGKTEPLDGGGAALQTILRDGTVLAPKEFFTAHLGADIKADESGWSMTFGDTEISGTVGAKEYIAGQKKGSFTQPPEMQSGTLYLPAAEAAQACGKQVVTDGRLVVIGNDNAVKVLERAGGVNELTEVVAYLTAHVETDPNSFTAEDCKAVKDKWRFELVGSETDNDMSNPSIANKIKQVDTNGNNAWKAFIKKEGSKELFDGIVTTTSNHMTQTYAKLNQMALAYGTYGTSLYQNEKLKADILYGLEWMYKNRYGRAEMAGAGWRKTSEFNWWDWQIGSPNQLIPIMLILEDALTPAQAKDYLALFDQLVPAAKDVGANALNTARLSIGSALLQNDAKKVLRIQGQIDSLFLYVDNNRNTASQLFGNRCEDRGQGFYTDGSYVFHTLHPMNGTYGMEQFQLTGPILSMFAGTAFEITNPQADNVADWIYNGFEPLLYQGAMFRMVKGRGPTGQHGSGATAVKGMLSLLDSLAPEDQHRVKQIVKKQVQEDSITNYYSTMGLNEAIALNQIMNDPAIQPKGDYLLNKVYYNEDKVVHQRENFGMGISMFSSRMFDYECINNENLTGWYISNGMIEYNIKDNFTQMSNAYWNDIDPYRLPGTTVDTQERKAVSIAQGNEYLSSKDFVGGVSLDDTYGAAAMWLESYHNETDYGKDGGEYGGPAPKHDCNLLAKKSYFMFDDEVVCMGSDISASNGYDVLTVVDNRLATKTRNLSNEPNSNEPYQILTAEASETPEAENVAENTLDGNYGSKWAAEMNATITWDLGEEKELGFALLSFQNGSKRTQKFRLEISADGTNWTQTFEGSSGGKTETDEAFSLDKTTGRYVRFTNLGNSAGSAWVSLTTVKVYPPNPDGSIKAPKISTVGADIFTVDGQQKTLTGEECSLKDAAWAHLEHAAGYYFPQGGNLFARYTESTNSFLELWLNHGKDPQGGSYLYAMLPGKTAEQTAAYAADPDVEILSNTPDIQAVREKKLGITGIVFWNAGSFAGITVNQPMIVMVQESGTVYKLSVSDPTRKLSTAKITLDKAMTATKTDPKMTAQTESNTQIAIDFTGSDGRSMEAVFDLGEL